MTAQNVRKTENASDQGRRPSRQRLLTHSKFKRAYELEPSITLAPKLTVTDASNTTLDSATISITGGTFTGDGDFLGILNATPTGLNTWTIPGTSITASYDALAETLTLSGTDTIAAYQSALDSITFTTPSLDPTQSGADTMRTVTWTVNDGSNPSSPATTTVGIDILGLDTSTAITRPEATVIKSSGYQFVIRYLAGSKNVAQLTSREEGRLAAEKLSIVSVYENKNINDNATAAYLAKFFRTDVPKGKATSNAYNNGYIDAEKAFKAADDLKQPLGSAIYFAIDIDPGAYISIGETALLNGIDQYFEGINAYAKSHPGYDIGVYGAPDTVAQITGDGLASYSWLTTSFQSRQISNSDAVAASDWNLWQPNVNRHNTTWLPGSDPVISAPGNVPVAGITIDTDYANGSLGSFGAWTPDPSSAPSTNVSAQSVSLLVQSMASFGH